MIMKNSRQFSAPYREGALLGFSNRGFPIGRLTDSLAENR